MSAISIIDQKPVSVVFEGVVVIFYIIPLFFSLFTYVQHYTQLLLSLLVILVCASVIPLLSLALVGWLSKKIEVTLDLTV